MTRHSLRSFGAAAAAAAVAAVLAGCGGEPPSVDAPAKEYIVGAKRIAGTIEREAGYSRPADEELGPPDVTLEIVAAIGGWDPAEIRVKRGQVVELRLLGADDGVLPSITGITRFTGHGFHVYGYDIWVNGLRSGVEKTIKFRADEAGEFPYECSVFCSPDHYRMIGRMIVE